jgi:hypothetical protein
MNKSSKHNRYLTNGAFGGASRRTSIKSSKGWVPGKNRGVNCDLTPKDKSMQSLGFRKKQNLKLRRPPAHMCSDRMRAISDIQPEPSLVNEDEVILDLMDDVLEEIK